MENKPMRYKEYKVLSFTGDEITEKIPSKRGHVSIYPHEAERINKTFKTNKFFYELDKEFEDTLNQPTREELKKQANELGIEFPNNIKTDKLIELINKAK
jgi:hypothetical protein